jgi:XTP/dITP diphosphohydrolase
MIKILFGTSNPNKVKEANAILGSEFHLMGLHEVNINEEIPETSGTIEGNSKQKARYIHEKTGMNCFSEDTGLEIEILDWQPGVDTAHFAGPERDANLNNQKVLTLLENKENRKARFRTVITLIIDKEEIIFEGIAEGTISKELLGSNGFGYDPIFIPNNYQESYAQIDASVKNIISHRAKAMSRMKKYLLGKYEDQFTTLD